MQPGHHIITCGLFCGLTILGVPLFSFPGLDIRLFFSSSWSLRSLLSKNCAFLSGAAFLSGGAAFLAEALLSCHCSSFSRRSSSLVSGAAEEADLLDDAAGVTGTAGTEARPDGVDIAHQPSRFLYLWRSSTDPNRHFRGLPVNVSFRQVRYPTFSPASHIFWHLAGGTGCNSEKTADREAQWRTTSGNPALIWPSKMW